MNKKAPTPEQIRKAASLAINYGIFGNGRQMGKSALNDFFNTFKCQMCWEFSDTELVDIQDTRVCNKCASIISTEMGKILYGKAT